MEIVLFGPFVYHRQQSADFGLGPRGREFESLRSDSDFHLK